MGIGWEKLRGLRLRPFAAAGGRLARWSGSAALDLLYPPSCAGCAADLDSVSDTPFCDRCLEQVEEFCGTNCARCGAPVAGGFRLVRCYRCEGTKLWFDETIALGAYEGPLRDWLLRLKHGRAEALAIALADMIWTNFSERLAAIQPDVVVSLPMHWWRRLARGTNSPDLLAERLAGHLRAPLAPQLLRRTRHTPPQSSLPPSARADNVRNAFAVRGGYHLNAAHVLLVDDILTTGSTCSAAAKALKQAGAARVVVVVVARTLRH